MNSAWIRVQEQMIFETTTKDWQSVDRRNIPKSWPRYWKRPCTDIGNGMGTFCKGTADKVKPT